MDDWSCTCSFCGSDNCHEYNDVIQCFACKQRLYKKNQESLFAVIPITEDMKTKARERSRRTQETADNLGLKQHFVSEDNKLIGFVGEEAFACWLEDMKIPFNRDIVYGCSDNGDFQINDKIIDVKTTRVLYVTPSDYTDKLNMLIASQQLSRVVDFYIQAFIDRDFSKVYFTGFITYEKSKDYPVTVTDKEINASGHLKIPIGELTSMRDFKKALSLNLLA